MSSLAWAGSPEKMILWGSRLCRPQRRPFVLSPSRQNGVLRIMAPRANWKGFLRLSLVTCPVALYPATSESREDLLQPDQPADRSPHQVHEGGRGYWRGGRQRGHRQGLRA